jgi:hypothetical protein
MFHIISQFPSVFSSIFFISFHYSTFLPYFPYHFAMKWYGTYGRKVRRIVKRYEKYGRNPSLIVIRYGKYGRKASRIVKRFGIFHIFHIFSLFNLLFFHIFHIISQISSVFSKSFHCSTCLSSIFSISFHKNVLPHLSWVVKRYEKNGRKYRRKLWNIWMFEKWKKLMAFGWQYKPQWPQNLANKHCFVCMMSSSLKLSSNPESSNPSSAFNEKEIKRTKKNLILIQELHQKHFIHPQR